MKAWRVAVPMLIGASMAGLLLLPPGENHGSDHRGYWDEERQEYVVEETSPIFGTTTGRILGQFTFHFLLVSLLFAYPRPLGRIGHRLRTRFHRGLGITILVLAILHAVVLLQTQVFRGWLTGVVSFTVLVVHASTGFAKTAYLRRLGPDGWRYIHLASGWTGILVGLQHALFYGQHYGLLQDWFFGGS